MEGPSPTTPPRPTIPVPPNAPKKPLTSYTNTATTNSNAARILLLE
jgi:hypothetical protein